MRIFSLLVLLLVGCQSTSETPLSEQQQTQVGNYTAQIEHYRQALAQRPGDIKVKQKLATLFYLNGDNESADFFAEQVLEQSPVHGDMYFVRGQVAMNRQNYVYALRQFQKAIHCKQPYADTGYLFINVGIVNAMIGDYEKAIDYTNKARLLGYETRAVKNNLAVIAMSQGDYKTSLELLEPIMKQYPEDESIRVNAGVSMIALGYLQQAKLLLGDDYPLAVRSLAESQGENTL
ncbi:tetratricopeptide repeat protein [Aliagarivorans taiwanensis]|uniref:tetratricopeptide repeat protein n=1 Tax=Aliagarivorans taiwanensis TaxID=561966 RepID=UPI00040A9652|nr:tetratricopeptide repeat protein [Aliagarivorans taiwanensis]